MIAYLKQFAIRICPKPLLIFLHGVLCKCAAVLGRLDMVLFPQKMTRYCPCCGMRFRSFVAGNFKNHPEYYDPSRYEHARQDVLCPVCKSLPRHRIMVLWCEKKREWLRRAKILFFAPNKSESMWLKRNKVSCVTADLYGKADLKLDIQKTGLPDESYDAIICNHVLEHLDDFKMALKEMLRVLRPGGSFICSFPMSPDVEFLDEDLSVQSDEERIRRFGQNDHKRIFGLKADRFLTEAGFTVEKICGEDYPEEILPVVGPADYDRNLLFRCIKQVQS